MLLGRETGEGEPAARLIKIVIKIIGVKQNVIITTTNNNDTNKHAERNKDTTDSK